MPNGGDSNGANGPNGTNGGGVQNGQGQNGAQQNPNNLAQDSLSLMQLKRLVGENARNVQPEYAFEYRPSDTLPNELSEWFTYAHGDLLLLITGARQAFEHTYTRLSLPPHQSEAPRGKISRWTMSKDVKRRRYISRCCDLLEHVDQEERVRGLEGLSFVAQGVYGELHDHHEQMDWIKRNNKLLRNVGVAEAVFGCLRQAFDREWEFAHQASAATGGLANPAEIDPDEIFNQKALNRRELKHSMTILYFLIEVTRQVSEEETEDKNIGFDEELESFRDEIAQLPGEGGLLGFLVKSIAHMRWEDNVEIQLAHPILLAWKTALLLFGSPDKHLPKVKQFSRMAEGLSAEVDKNQISANPLDYFLFRQELIAKYPAYNPPKPLFAFDANSYLPSLIQPESSTRSVGNSDVLLGGKGGGENLVSILEKAVHIATPAPSPPPSPIGVGKLTKKQNYQTNQSFPFMFPPADSEEGGGVPKSIKEAGELFSGRTRISLAMRQLWKEKEAFEKYGRGWSADPALGEGDFAPSQSLRNSWNIFGKRRNGGGSNDNQPTPLSAIDEDAPHIGWQERKERERQEREAAEKKQWEDLDTVRLREITSKGVTALLLVLLKWFRVSHVLKFEYLSQLLWDSNLVPLVLKILNQQDIVHTLTTKTDRPERGYFQVCNLHSLSPRQYTNTSSESSSPDDACPPPIRFSAHQNPAPQQPSESSPPPSDQQLPEVITEYSWRNFFTSINIMRILQKVVKGKAHRNLALVQFRSSVILRKPLKCPQRELRLYTLKVFKGQVPYCGRKWRHGNMRVITSIYLYCRPELRDDWLAGGDVDNEVEEAGPQEEALRALTLFYNVSWFPKSMGADLGLLEEERDFFRRECVRLDEVERDEMEGEEFGQQVWS
ncbi:hypothetical protein FPQ18DRAFT_259634 [Pyronema domesticum]|nr:hypothetical protein FPQ18DRAFT_259634 [Pyronema domesticum]